MYMMGPGNSAQADGFRQDPGKKTVPEGKEKGTPPVGSAPETFGRPSNHAVTVTVEPPLTRQGFFFGWLRAERSATSAIHQDACRVPGMV